MHMPSLTSIAALVLSVPAAAQQTLTFTVDPAASQFTWSGTTSLGPIVGNPSNQFHLEGTTVLDLALAAPPQGASDAAFTGGDAAVVPDLHGKIPNLFPFLPPLATVDVLGLHFQALAPGFPVAADHTWTGSITIAALAGTLNVTPLGQSTSSTPLAGSQSSPSSSSGTLSLTGSKLHLVAPVNTTFPFSDPASGASGSITIVGTLVADHALSLAYGFGDGSSGACPCGNQSTTASASGCLNSTGAGGKLVTSGFPSISADTLLLQGSGMPATATALYFQGTSPLSAGVVAGDGLRVAGGTILRLGVAANVGGASSFPPAGSSLATLGLVTPGTTLGYQIWYRDPASFCTDGTYNFSNGAAVLWTP
jgi:hypothetical protein